MNPEAIQARAALALAREMNEKLLARLSANNAKLTTLSLRVGQLEANLYVANAALEAAEAQRDTLAAILRKTIYSPPGYKGPPVWWEAEALAALVAIEPP